MNWDQAYQLIITNIVEGMPLNATGRSIIKAPPYQCKNHDYIGEGYKVKIGKKTHIEIPMTMLQIVFEDAVANNRTYNKNIFRIHYRIRAESKTGHGCHIHVVGKIFEFAGVAEKINNREYRVL
jgi:hypothetical protein